VILYDPVVAIQIAASIYGFSYTRPEGGIPLIACTILLLLSLALFWWSINTTRNLDFAFSTEVGELIISGPYAVIRHPFYLSYILGWLSTTLLFNSIFHWITLVYLATFYLSSARSEEKVILRTEHSSEYIRYQQKVGMFIPRKRKWKS